MCFTVNMGTKAEFEPLSLHSNPSDWLKAEYLRRQGKNPQYSLRAFARHLRVPVGSLSELFSKKREMTLKLGQRIAENLVLPENESKMLAEMIAEGKSRKRALVKLDSYLPETDYRKISLDTFEAIAHGYHYAILSLTETVGFDPSPSAIAKRLGIPIAQAEEGV
jgi:hypothetical protein